VITKRDDGSAGLTGEVLLALPAAVDLETANRALSLSRAPGYDLAKRGRYPCTALRLGMHRVVTADLLRVAVLVGVRRVGGETTDDGDRSPVWDLDKPCDHRVATELADRFVALPTGRGAQGERGRPWTVQHGI
jgi:hypothetical protein